MNLPDHRAIFEHVKNHLLTQGVKAIEGGEGGGCRYSVTTYGMHLRCAVGCLIEDIYYDNRMEGNLFVEIDGDGGYLKRSKGIVYDAVMNSIRRPLELADIIVLRKLQLIHDRHEPSEWPTLLDKLEAQL